MEFTTNLTSRKEIKEVARLLVDTFSNDPVVKEIYKDENYFPFYHLLTAYYAHNEKILIAKEKEKIVGAMLWNDINPQQMDFKRLFKTEPLLTSYFLITCSKELMNRIKEWFKIAEKHHYSKEEHCYIPLFAVAESGKGYGRMMMNEFLKDMTYEVYLENSNPSKNDAFYAKCGFKHIGSFEAFGQTIHQCLYTPQSNFHY